MAYKITWSVEAKLTYLSILESIHKLVRKGNYSLLQFST